MREQTRTKKCNKKEEEEHPAIFAYKFKRQFLPRKSPVNFAESFFLIDSILFVTIVISKMIVHHLIFAYS